MFKLDKDLKFAKGARKRPFRKGRGTASGAGKTAGRGQKGQGAKENVRPGFEGGQMPLVRRLPKRGFKSPFKKQWNEVNVGRLEGFDAGTEITPELLLANRVIRQLRDGVKILGNGDLSHKLVVKAHHFSRLAAEKIKAAGGTTELI